MNISTYVKLVDCVVQVCSSYSNFPILLVFRKDVLKLSTMIVCFPFLFVILSDFVLESVLLGTYFVQDYYIFLMNHPLSFR